MTDNQNRVEAIWTYEISKEKILKRLVEKGYITKEDADEYSRTMFEQLNLNEIPGFVMTSVGEKMRATKITNVKSDEFVSLTEIARQKSQDAPGYLIQSWLRNYNVIEFIKYWENKNNPDFDNVECDKLIELIKTTATTLTLKLWITKTNAIGFISKQGKNGGTLAHAEIASTFKAWLFPEIMLELVKGNSDH